MNQTFTVSIHDDEWQTYEVGCTNAFSAVETAMVRHSKAGFRLSHASAIQCEVLSTEALPPTPIRGLNSYGEPLCGHYNELGFGPCVCGDRANHEPGGKYHQRRVNEHSVA